MTIPQVPIQLLVESAERKADLYINGDITRGFQFFGIDFGQDTDVSYQDVVEALNDLPLEVEDIYVHINSYGGEVAEGVAIYNALRSSAAKVTTVCEGFACSIASVVFMAGQTRMMRDSSLLMLHNASMRADGDANAHRKAAEDLEVITELSKTAYLNHAKGELTREKLTEIMDAETWITSEQALEWGLATDVDAPVDNDEPNQSIRNRVVQKLASNDDPQFIQGVSEEIDVEGIASRVAELVAQMLPVQHAEDDPDPEPDPEPDPTESNESRMAKIFAQLAE